ncbi:MAG: class I SAM-dependent methyltransferase [Terracidiphilus sp.]
MIPFASDLHLAGSAFDTIAESYDSLFTTSTIGCSQRSAIWRKAKTVFQAGDRVLELNCGTGRDALFLASLGVAVTACDASVGMIRQARARKSEEAPRAAVDFRVLSTECLQELPPHLCFDGVFSNFSGLNCVADIQKTAKLLAGRIYPGGQLLLCMSTRFCAWEMLHYLSQGDVRKAFRRCRGTTQARMGPYSLPVYYPTVHALVHSFGRMFRLRSVTGIGVAVPPSYMESWARGNPLIFRMCESFDRVACSWPGIRVLGDHMLLHLERA